MVIWNIPERVLHNIEQFSVIAHCGATSWNSPFSVVQYQKWIDHIWAVECSGRSIAQRCEILCDFTPWCNTLEFPTASFAAKSEWIQRVQCISALLRGDTGQSGTLSQKYHFRRKWEWECPYLTNLSSDFPMLPKAVEKNTGKDLFFTQVEKARMICKLKDFKQEAQKGFIIFPLIIALMFYDHCMSAGQNWSGHSLNFYVCCMPAL